MSRWRYSVALKAEAEGMTFDDVVEVTATGVDSAMHKALTDHMVAPMKDEGWEDDKITHVSFSITRLGRVVARPKKKAGGT